MINLSTVVTIALIVGGQGQETNGAAKSQAAQSMRERLLKLHHDDAAEYVIHRDSDHKEKAELQAKPIYVWTNPVRDSQQGALFVWTYRGRPEVVGCIFSALASDVRSVNHEFHSLALSKLDVAREGTHEDGWKPEAPGIALKPVEDAQPPAGTAAKRLAQMRSLSREFSANSEDAQEKRWELRLLPQPLFRYESKDPDVLDGALFAFVTSAGTDPEVLLVLEARRPSGGGEPVWQYGVARFSDLGLAVRRKGKEVFTAPMIKGNQPELYPRQEYRVFRDRGIPKVEGETP